MSNLKNIMNKVLETVCVFIFAFITVVGTYQIVVRYVFNSPSTVSEELLTYSFTWLALLAAALVFGMKEHMAMTYFADKIKGKKRSYSNAFCYFRFNIRWHINYKTYNDTGYSISWNTNGLCICCSSY